MIRDIEITRVDCIYIYIYIYILAEKRNASINSWVVFLKKIVDFI